MLDPSDQDSPAQEEEEPVSQYAGFRLAAYIIFWIAVLLGPLILLVFLLDLFTPRLWFPFLVPLVLLLWLGIVYSFFIKIIRDIWNMRKQRKAFLMVPRTPYTKRKAVLHFLIFCVIASFIYLACYLVNPRVDKGILEEAQQHFSVTVIGEIDETKIDLTLIELERALRHMNTRLETPTSLPLIEVHLYTDREAFQKDTDRPEWTVGLAGCREDGPIIALPVMDIEGGPGSKGTSFTSLHEMVHITSCVIAGANNSKNIPDWFKEGMAEYETNKGFWRMQERVLSRFYLWSNGDRLFGAGTFNSYTLDAPDEDFAIFYCSSHEFMRYIVGRFGEDAPWHILYEIRDGRAFNDAFTYITGVEPLVLYSEWLAGF